MVIQDVKTFGLGVFTLTDTTGTYAQPRPVAIVKDVTIEFGASTKELRGQNGYAEDIAVTERKCSGKAKLGTIHGKMLASLLPGATIATGTTTPVTETKTAATSVTATTTTGFQDIGVLTSTGALMTKAATATGVGVYAVTSGGVYSFNASETGTLTLMYTVTSAGGFTVTHNQAAMGSQTSFTLTVFSTYTGNNGTSYTLGAKFFAVKCPKLSTALKVSDYAEFDIDFECYSDTTTGKVAEVYTSA